MPRITPKPPEVLEAQLAMFATRELDSPFDKGHIVRNIGELAAGGMDDVLRTVDELDEDFGGLGDYELGDIRVAASKDDYVRFLRDTPVSERRQGVADRLEYLAAYGDFAPEVAQLRKELEGFKAKEHHPAFLGEGATATVYRISKDGTEYAVRLVEVEGAYQTVDSYMDAARLARGDKRFEQLVAASYKDGVTISQIMPGKDPDWLIYQEVARIKDEHLAGFVRTLADAARMGISIDFGGGNIIYDKNSGFGIIDYTSQAEAKTHFDSLQRSIHHGAMFIIENLGGINIRRNQVGRENPVLLEARRQALKNLRYDLLQKYRACVEAQLSGQDLESSLKQIDALTASFVNKTDNP